MGVTHLLGIHVLLWVVGDPSRLSAARVRLGTLDVGNLVETWSQRVEGMGGVSLPVSTEHGLLAGSMVLVTADAVMQSVPSLRTLVA